MKSRGLIALSMIATFSSQALSPTTALADQEAPAAAAPAVDTRAAAKALKEGKRLLVKRQLPEAIAKFEEALARDPARHEALYQSGFAHQLNQSFEPAIDFYRRYLAAEPNGKYAPEAKRYLLGLETRAEADRKKREAAEAAKKKEEDEKNKLANAERDREAARTEASAALARATKAEAELAAERAKPRAVASSSRSQASSAGEVTRLMGVGLGVAGVAGLAAGAYFAARSSRLSDELSEENAVYYPDKVKDGEAADRNMTIAFVAGGVLLAGGVAAYVFGRAQGKERPRAALAPSAQPGGGGLVVTGAW
jgi:tetratricopeptide (TPR) repeat protein